MDSASVAVSCALWQFCKYHKWASLGRQPSVSIAIFSSSSMDSIVHVYEVKVLTLLTIRLFAFSHVQLTGFSTSGSPRIAACVARPLSPAGVWSGHETTVTINTLTLVLSVRLSVCVCVCVCNGCGVILCVHS